RHAYSRCAHDEHDVPMTCAHFSRIGHYLGHNFIRIYTAFYGMAWNKVAPILEGKRQTRRTLRNRPEPASLTDAEPAEYHPQQIIRSELPGDAVQPLLRQPQFFGEQIQRLIIARRQFGGDVEMFTRRF